MQTEIQQYYGKELNSTQDLKTNACCTLVPPPQHIRDALALIHDEVTSKYYGCGLTIPAAIKNLEVLDLGSGSGRDSYILSRLVGEKGRVTGVDMTDEQLDVARRHMDYHQDKFGHKERNLSFVKGDIEDLSSCLPKDTRFDLVVSNCVLNLTQNKLKVLEDVFALLKEGGEFYFSDVYADRRLPKDLQQDPMLWSECLSGALYWNDFLSMARAAGFADPRAVESKEVTINNDAVKIRVGAARFYSVTYRLFKLKNLENNCEEYGQAVRYVGGVEEMPEVFLLDGNHLFEKGRMYTVCGNTFLMLHESRFKEHFEFWGDFDKHFGLFEGCGQSRPFNQNQVSTGMACC